MKVQIYGKPSCPGCEAAKLLCKSKAIDFEYKVVGSDIQKEQLEEMIGQPIRTVPQIFVTSDGFSQYLGGLQDLSKYLNTQGNI